MNTAADKSAAAVAADSRADHASNVVKAPATIAVNKPSAIKAAVLAAFMEGHHCSPLANIKTRCHAQELCAKRTVIAAAKQTTNRTIIFLALSTWFAPKGNCYQCRAAQSQVSDPSQKGAMSTSPDIL